MLDLIKRKVLRDYHLPIDVQKMRREQQMCPHFHKVYSGADPGFLEGGGSGSSQRAFSKGTS